MSNKPGKNVSQKLLVEILIEEVESLKRSKKDHLDMLSKVESHISRLESLYDRPLSVDMCGIESMRNKIENSLHRFLVLPKWALILFLSLIFALLLSLWCNYQQHTWYHQSCSQVSKCQSVQ